MGTGRPGQGGVPEILKFQGTQELEEFLVKDLKDCVNRGEYRLVIPYVEESELTKKVKDCLHK